MNTPLPEPWGAYLRLQSDLRSSSRIDNRTWAVESALDVILNHSATVPSPDDSLTVNTAIATAERRERHRRRLRRTYQSDLTPTAVDVPAWAEAAILLDKVRQSLAPPDWDLVVAVGEGHQYGDLAPRFGVSAAALRIRTMRIRQTAQRLAA